MISSRIIQSKALTRGTPSSVALSQIRRFPSQSNTRNHFSSKTYYDSQSGMHVPLHNVQEISIILDKSQEDTNLSTSFVPAHLYKEDPSSDMPEQLANLSKLGVQGIILPPLSFPRDVRNLLTLRNIVPTPDFLFFASAKDIPSATPVLKDPNHVSLILEFDANDDNNINESNDNSITNYLDQINQAVSGGGGGDTTILNNTRVNTTIALKNVGHEDQNPISIANQVASWIDKNPNGGGDYIWIPSANKGADTDALERLCEELSYLDLVGKTVASRLIVGGGGGGEDASSSSSSSGVSVSEDLVEETMFSGVNKFVVSKEDDISVIAEIAESQGKSILVAAES